MISCPQTSFTGATYGDVVQHLAAVNSERAICAARIECIKQWAKDEQK